MMWEVDYGSREILVLWCDCPGLVEIHNTAIEYHVKKLWKSYYVIDH